MEVKSGNYIRKLVVNRRFGRACRVPRNHAARFLSLDFGGVDHDPPYPGDHRRHPRGPVRRRGDRAHLRYFQPHPGEYERNPLRHRLPQPARVGIAARLPFGRRVGDLLAHRAVEETPRGHRGLGPRRGGTHESRARGARRDERFGASSPAGPRAFPSGPSSGTIFVANGIPEGSRLGILCTLVVAAWSGISSSKGKSRLSGEK